MSELGPEARALLEHTRDGDDPSELDRARLRNRLGVALAAAATTAAVSAAAPAAATSVSAAAATTTATATKAAIGVQVAAGAQAVVATSVTAKISVAVTVAVISVAGSGVVLKQELSPATSARQPAAQVAPRTPRAKQRAAREPALAAPVIAAPAPEVPVVLPEPQLAVVQAPAAVALPAPVANVARSLVPKPVPKPKVVEPALAPQPDEIPQSMQTEIQLLSFAQSALRDGDYDRALSVLAEHASRFPNGVLALERDAVRAITLCSSGRATTGRFAAEALGSRIEGTPLAARLERACK
jgi:hypothetical protein